MIMDKRNKAFAMAQEAAKLDFSGAMQGLLAGHEASLKEMREKLTAKDMSFLMALCLTEKGKRLDTGGIMAAKIREGLEGLSLCEVEERFIETHSK